MKDLTKGYPAKVIILFALPIMFGSIFQMLYNFADSMIVSNYINEDALASVGATAVISHTLISFINGATQGFAIPIARFFGANDKDSIRKYVGQTFILTGIITVILTGVSLVAVEPLLRLLNTPEILMKDSLDYIRIIIAALVFTALYNCCANILRSLGNSKIPLYFLMIAIFINVFLDILFVKTLGLGIKGAAYATVLAQLMSGGLTFIYIIIKYKEILPKKGDWGFTHESISELVPTGLAMALMGCIVNIGTVILQSGINNLGKTIIAAHTASRRIFDILTVFLYTVGISMTTFVSQNLGAKKYDRVKTGIRHAIIITTVESVMLIIFCWFMGEPLVRWITGSSNTDLINNSVMYIRISILNFFWLGPLFVLRCSLQGLGHKVVPLISSAIELAVKITSVIVLTPLLGYLGVAITEPISWFLMMVLLTIMYIHAKKELGVKEAIISES